MTDDERAEKIAIAYIKNLDGYKSYNGRQLKFKSITKSGSNGDYVVDATFWRDARTSDYATEEPINVHLNIRKWKADSYTFN